MKFSTTVLTDGQVKAMIRRRFDKKIARRARGYSVQAGHGKTIQGRYIQFVIFTLSKAVHLVSLFLMRNVLRDFDFLLPFY